MLDTWDKLKTFALDLNMPHVTEATAWGNPVLKAHGKMWCWWSPYVEAALFKCPIDERAMLRDADPEMFISHPHYEKHNLVLVAGAPRPTPHADVERACAQTRAASLGGRTGG